MQNQQQPEHVKRLLDVVIEDCTVPVMAERRNLGLPKPNDVEVQWIAYALSRVAIFMMIVGSKEMGKWTPEQWCEFYHWVQANSRPRMDISRN